MSLRNPGIDFLPILSNSYILGLVIIICVALQHIPAGSSKKGYCLFGFGNSFLTLI